MKSARFSTAVHPLQWALLRRWEELPHLRKLHSKIVSPEEGVRPYLKALEAIQAEYIVTLLAAHALCEALINCALALALAEQGKEELFVVLERCDFLEKWATAPRAIVESYRFDRSSAMYDTMSRMNTHRNFYLHNKASVESEGRTIYAGSKSKRRDLKGDIDWMHRYISLPFDLSESLLSYPEFRLAGCLLDRKGVSRASQHKP